MKAHHHHPDQILLLTIGILGNITSIMMYLAPMWTFWRVYRSKSTEGFHSVPYVASQFSAMLWIYYAVLKSNDLLLVVNSVGFAVETFYILAFVAYAPKQAKILTVKLVSVTSVGGFIAILVLTRFFAKGEVRLQVVGWLCAALSCFMFASPLTIMRQVMHTKSVEFMPFTLSFFLFLSATLWLAYGLLLHDYYIMIPNGVGVVLGMAQMFLYGCYCKERKKGSVENQNGNAESGGGLNSLEVESGC
ncbi:unnamed protein product [Linum trigynum]|uniref:Bidirectional sugar transporter SWEET n=1 Tax=Linum trigynum TaxID=586398 RepID=A0AAV2G816_9ROSI